MNTHNYDENNITSYDQNGYGITYKRYVGDKNIGIIFVQGFMSDMEGEIPSAVETFCKNFGYSFIRYNCTGIGDAPGQSSNTIPSIWFKNLLHVIDELTFGHQIIVGRSLGALFGLLAAEIHKDRICGLVCINTALNIEDLITNAKLQVSGEKFYIPPPCDLHTTAAVLEDLKNFYFPNILKSGVLDVSCPVRFIHGMKDELVPYEYSCKILNKIKTNNCLLTLSKNGNHKFIGTQDIVLVTRTIEDLLKDVSKM